MVQSRLVSTLLTPALRLWLRSQVESIASLTLDIEGGDRQILGGHIPGVSLQAQQAIYQGLHLSQLDMMASTIRVNIGQVVRGKPLKLLAPIPVQTALFLEADGLKQSASAPLLKEALTELWQTLARVAPNLMTCSAKGTPTLHCGDDYLEIRIVPEFQPIDGLPSPSHSSSSFFLRTNLKVVEGHLLQFNRPHLYSPDQPDPIPVDSLEGFHIDLGHDVTIQSLDLRAAGIHCQGKILVKP